MRMRPLTAVIVLVGVWSPSLQGATHSLPEAAMEADAIVLVDTIVPVEGTQQLKMSVGKVLFGDVEKKDITVSFTSVFRMATPKAINAQRLVFLRSQAGKFSLYGAGLQSIWPLGDDPSIESYRYPYESARDLTAVVGICQELLSVRAEADSTKRTALVARLAESDDSFVRLIGMQLCIALYHKDAEKYREQVEVGAAFALESIQVRERDMLLYYAGSELAHAAPPSAALRSLLNVIEHPSSGVVRQNNAFLHFVKISGTSGKFEFQHTARTPEEKKRAEALKAIQEWFEEARPALIRRDAQKILAALRSDELLRRKLGRLWLEGAARLAFGYEEKASSEDRAAALERIEKWFREFGAETEPATQPSKALSPPTVKGDDGVTLVAAALALRDASTPCSLT
jgi:hypothetical protein